jgi:hypothetical protein
LEHTAHQCPIEGLTRLKTEDDFSGNLSMRTGGGWTRTSVVRRRGIYSPLQLPLCDTPVEKERMLAKGLEPSTVRLQGGCSTIELHQH